MLTHSVFSWLESSFIFCSSLLFPLFEGNTLVNEFWELCTQTVSIFLQVVGNFIDRCLRSFSEIQGKWLHLFAFSLATKEHPCWLTSFSRCFCCCLVFSMILVKIPESCSCRYWQIAFSFFKLIIWKEGKFRTANIKLQKNIIKELIMAVIVTCYSIVFKTVVLGEEETVRETWSQTNQLSPDCQHRQLSVRVNTV